MWMMMMTDDVRLSDKNDQQQQQQVCVAVALLSGGDANVWLCTQVDAVSDVSILAPVDIIHALLTINIQSASRITTASHAVFSAQVRVVH